MLLSGFSASVRVEGWECLVVVARLEISFTLEQSMARACCCSLSPQSYHTLFLFLTLRLLLRENTLSFHVKLVKSAAGWLQFIWTLYFLVDK